MGRGLEDLADRVVAADLLELPALVQLLDERDGVDRLAEVVEVADRPVDRLMAVAVEVLDLDQGDDIVERLVVEQDAPNAEFGLEILGREPVPARTGRVVAVVAVPVSAPIPVAAVGVAVRVVVHGPARLRPNLAIVPRIEASRPSIELRTGREIGKDHRGGTRGRNGDGPAYLNNGIGRPASWP